MNFFGEIEILKKINKRTLSLICDSNDTKLYFTPKEVNNKSNIIGLFEWFTNMFFE